MSKFNKKTEPVVPTAVNKMGTKAYKLDPKEELVATILTTFLSRSYYETEKSIVARINAAALKVDPLFVAKAALYARNDANMRSSTHLLAGELASRVQGESWGKRFYRKIAVRPDDMAEILAYYANVKRAGDNKLKIPNSMKRGFRSKLASMDPYLIDKYKMDSKQFSLAKLVMLMHPNGNQDTSEAYRRLLNNEPLDDMYGSKILEKTMSAAGQGKKSKKAVDKAKGEAISEVLGGVAGMPIMNLIRNLKNIILYAPDSVPEACRQLTIRTKILKSRQLPFRFLSAYEEIAKMGVPIVKSHTSVMFEDEIASRKASATEVNALKPKVLAALETAMDISCENIPKLEGRTAILVDHSGSMRGDGGGSSLVSAFSKVSTSMIANLFGTMMMMTQDNIFMGLFGDRLVPVTDFNRSKGILANASHIHRLGGSCGGGTEQGVYDFFLDIIKNKTKVDNVIVFSDMVIGNANRWYGLSRFGRDASDYRVGSGDFQTMFKDFRKVNPACNVVSVNIKQTEGTSVFDKSLNVTQVAGWSNNIFDVVSGGTRGYKDIIKEIEAIVI